MLSSTYSPSSASSMESFDRSSALTATSRTPLLPSLQRWRFSKKANPKSSSSSAAKPSPISTPVAPPGKDFEAAFASLSSSYGFSSSAPAPIPKTETKLKQPRRSVPLSPPPSSTLLASSQKDFGSAFAKSSSTYGFTGGAPSLPPRPRDSY